jgi:DNA-directed RNA polymerase specialized sigma24 family protein
LKDGGEREEFRRFVCKVEPRLRRALVAAYGPERGREATAEALAWAFEHRNRLDSLQYPAAFLYRVGQTRSRSRSERLVFERAIFDEPWIEPKLAAALAFLSEDQRFAVFMVHGAGWTQVEVAELLGVRPSTVQRRVERGMTKLRLKIGGVTDVPQ